MQSRDKFETGGQLFLFIGQAIVFFICISYIEFYYTNNILPDKHVKNNFYEATCTLLNKQLTTQGRILHSYRSEFLISYTTANNLQYTRWVSGNGLDQSFTSNRSSQQALLDQYNVGSTYTCWYDPTTPQLAVLVLRHNWLSTFPLLVPSLLALIVFYYMIRTIFEMIGLMAVATREKTQERKLNKK